MDTCIKGKKNEHPLCPCQPVAMEQERGTSQNLSYGGSVCFHCSLSEFDREECGGCLMTTALALSR